MWKRQLLLLITFINVCANGTLYAQDSVITNSIGMTFIRMEPGQFTMGRFQPPYPVPAADKNNSNGYSAKDYQLAKQLAQHDALPGFTVTISQPFYIGKYEVTQGQWKKVMGTNPSYFKRSVVTDDADQHPVENVTWAAAQAFIKKLNALEKTSCYRLPTEAEWEYAARAGSDSDIAWSDIRATAQIGKRSTQAVGGKQPNAWGLYDMLGNVWEWVQDHYNEKLFADPVPPLSGKEHVLKGASFVGDVKNATYKTHAAGPGNGWDVGFRIIKTCDH